MYFYCEIHLSQQHIDKQCELKTYIKYKINKKIYV